VSSQADADLLHLRRADVIGANNEALWVLIKQALFLINRKFHEKKLCFYFRNKKKKLIKNTHEHLLEVLVLPFGSSFLDHLGNQGSLCLVF
jgi:hypothetical protein